MTTGPGSAGPPVDPGPGGRPTGVAEPDLLPDYVAWLDRLTATFEAVRYTCAIRLGDRRAGEEVALLVATGLVARPGVFRYWGLPYSGRIAKLAEDGLIEATAGRPVCGGSWAEFRGALRALPPTRQADVVLTCVEGHDDEELAARWACDPPSAARRRDRVHALLRVLAEEHRRPIPSPLPGGAAPVAPPVS